MAEIRGVTEEQARAATPEKGWLKAYVKWAGAATDANLAYHLVSGLTVLAQSVPIDYGVPFGALTLYAPLYGLLIGDSTDARKTTAVNLASKLLEAAIPQRVGAEPGSAEAIVDDLAPNPQQIVFIGEYGAILAGAERGYATAIKTKWTQCYDCRPIARRKANGKGVTVATPRLSILAGIAPGYIERHTEPVDWTEGFLARHTTIYANRERYFEEPVRDYDLENKLITWLKGVAKADTYSNEAPLGPCLGFTSGASKLRAAWERRLVETAKNPRHSVVAPAIGRAPAMAIKIAGLLAWDWGLARTGGSWYVDEEAIEFAIRITDLHVQSVLGLSTWLAPDKDMRDRRKVLALIGRHPVRRGKIMHQSQLLKRTFGNIIDTLVEERAIRTEIVDGEHYYSINDDVPVDSFVRPETAPDPLDPAPEVFSESSPFSGPPPHVEIDPTAYD